MSGCTALLDGNVLYPAPIRDLLLELAVSDLYRAKWTADIHREWIDSLLNNEPHRKRADLERTRDKMDKATRDCLVTGYEALIPTLSLPDPKDNHVLAAAVVGRCNIIITQNLRDFPAEVLKPFGIYTQHPDAFLSTHLNRAQGSFCRCVQRIRQRLKKPPYTANEYLRTLTRVGLTDTAFGLSQYVDLI